MMGQYEECEIQDVPESRKLWNSWTGSQERKQNDKNGCGNVGHFIQMFRTGQWRAEGWWPGPPNVGHGPFSLKHFWARPVQGPSVHSTQVTDFDFVEKLLNLQQGSPRRYLHSDQKWHHRMLPVSCKSRYSCRHRLDRHNMIFRQNSARWHFALMWWPMYAVVRSSQIWGSHVSRELFHLESPNFT